MDLFINLRTVKEVIKANCTDLLVQLTQANQVFNTLSGQVTAGLHDNTMMLYQAVEELSKEEGHAEDLSACISQLGVKNQYLEDQHWEHKLKLP